MQIGAVKLDGASFEILGEFDVLVRPRVNPRVSPYFERLTGISNDLLGMNVGSISRKSMRGSQRLPPVAPPDLRLRP